MGINYIFNMIAILLCFYRKKAIDPTYYTSQGIISGGSQIFSSIEGRSTPTGLESACTVRNKFLFNYSYWSFKLYDCHVQAMS